jgi:hypothetical protein
MTCQRGREDDDHEPLPTPSFLSVPDLAHAIIASFLPDGNWGTEHSHQRVSEVLRDLLEFYGGTLIWLRVHEAHGRSADRLAAFLQRQKKLAKVIVDGPEETIPALCQAIMQGCCRGLERLDISAYFESSMTQEGVDLLARALESDGALPKLQALMVHCGKTPVALSKVTKALASGTSPLLEDLCLLWDDHCENDLDVITDMLEGRAHSRVQET